ncbi:tRNA pseudouridine38-40 synthase [Plasmodium inui San Antonio 1]|uniref:tRNA pseudouridine38-40 synthase n=1 Tax=Plasmodium inui San Antonio 1 TaxID=1237626 RepID=W7A0B1_9APIC|nr:tRNA pseudouridine38-40 synthase [Plasmodium inui San Antonio 1]EUD66582.1 tRNA pseudouridine38-40 synthase [Plasmodium inui San Antonio 1]
MNNYQKNKERIKRLKRIKLNGAKTRETCQTGETFETCQTSLTREKGPSAPRERLPNLKKYALCIGYVGSRYHGCQGQGKDCMTIENEIERTLIKMNAVRRGVCRKDFNFCQSRSARTDLGVHALYNVFVYQVDLSCGEAAASVGVVPTKVEAAKVEAADVVTNGDAAGAAPNADATTREIATQSATTHSSTTNGATTDRATTDRATTDSAALEERKKKEEKFVQMLNEHLPEDIRCFDMYRVTKSFDARKFCSFRLYEYLFPVYVLSEVAVRDEYRDVFVEALRVIDGRVEELKRRKRKEGDDAAEQKGEEEAVEKSHGDDATKQNSCDDASKQNSWDDILTVKEEKEELTEEELNAFFQIVQSYAGYHNFHCFTKNKVDQTTFRFIKYLDVSTVNLYDYNFVSVKILGQSFLMHQIRKMLTLSVETFRKATSPGSIYYCLKSGEYVPISLFPAEGLMLICPYFNAYNEKVCNPPQSPPICFQESDELLKFKRDVVAKCIIENMHRNVWKDWMLKMNKRPFVYHFMRDRLGDAKPSCERIE